MHSRKKIVFYESVKRPKWERCFECELGRCIREDIVASFDCGKCIPIRPKQILTSSTSKADEKHWKCIFSPLFSCYIEHFRLRFLHSFSFSLLSVVCFVWLTLSFRSYLLRYNRFFVYEHYSAVLWALVTILCEDGMLPLRKNVRCKVKFYALLVCTGMHIWYRSIVCFSFWHAFLGYFVFFLHIAFAIQKVLLIKPKEPVRETHTLYLIKWNSNGNSADETWREKKNRNCIHIYIYIIHIK